MNNQTVARAHNAATKSKEWSSVSGTHTKSVPPAHTVGKDSNFGMQTNRPTSLLAVPHHLPPANEIHGAPGKERNSPKKPEVPIQCHCSEHSLAKLTGSDVLIHFPV